MITATDRLRRLLNPTALLLCLWVTPTSLTLAQEKSVQGEVMDVIEALKGYSAEQRDEALESAKQAIAELDAQIAETERKLAKNWDSMSESARAQSEQTLRRLREGRNQLAEWYGGLKHSSGKAWGRVKEGFSAAYSSLREAWSAASKEFDSMQ